MADGSEPSKEFVAFDPVEVELDLMGDPMEVEAGDALDIAITLVLVETYDESGWQFSVGWERRY